MSHGLKLDPHSLSVVVPMFNEEDNAEPMTEAIQSALSTYGHPWELIYVDDGSSDNTINRLREMRHLYGEHIRVVELQRNFGQTAAMQAGIDSARGCILVTLDGDLQNDPNDIPKLVKRLQDEELDLLVGWRKNRKDNLWIRTIPSRIANRIIGYFSGIRMHDYGCTLKVYRMNVLQNIRFYGEMHRFIPAWVASYTSPSRIKEEVVNHRPRQFGESKYGLSRIYRVLLDLLSVYFFMKFKAKPGHFFGRFGIAFGGLGGLILTYLAFVKFALGEDIGQRPLLFIGILFIVVAIQFLTTGILGELMSRTYYESSGAKPYVIRHKELIEITEDATWFRPSQPDST